MIIVVIEIIKKYNLSTKMERVEINPLITLKPQKVAVSLNPRSNER